MLIFPLLMRGRIFSNESPHELLSNGQVDAHAVFSYALVNSAFDH